MAWISPSFFLSLVFDFCWIRTLGSLFSESLELRIDGVRLGLPLTGEGEALGNVPREASRYGSAAGVPIPVKDLPTALPTSGFG